MILSEIIQRIQSLYSKGVQSDDVRLSDRHIYNKILTVRSKLISQQAKKRQKISQWNYQTINCAEIIKAPIFECPCIPPVGCSIYRTKNKIPEPLTDLNNHLIQSVTSLDGTTIFSEITWNEKKYKSSNKYTSNKPDFFVRNDYIYITASSLFTGVISITGLFEDPFEVIKFEAFCECEDCDPCLSPLDINFPIDNDSIDTLIEMCVNELIVLFSQNKEDKTNNSSDSLIETSK